MKKLNILLLFLGVALSAVAQSAAPFRALSSSQRVVGYTISDAITTQNVGTGYAGTHPVGALLTADMLKTYVGCKIVGIRFALSSSVQTSRVFVRPVTAAGYLADADSVTQNVWHPHAGWNEIMFNGVKGYTIRQGESLFFGFDVTETADQAQAGTGILATTGQSQSMGFLVLGNFGSGEGLYAVSDKGLLCVQLIVDVSSLPSLAFTFTDITNGYQYYQPGEWLDFFTQYTNSGRDTIKSYTINYAIDNNLILSHDTVDAIAGGAQSSFQRTYQLPSDIPSGQHVLRIYITQANGTMMAAQPYIADTFCVYREKFERQQTYLEQYADETSPYTAGCFDAMQSAYSELNGQVAYVNVYRSNNPLAYAAANSLSEDYAYTYPSFTMDRSYYPGEAHIAYDFNDYVLAAPALVSGMMKELLQEEHAHPAFAKLNIDPQYDASSRLLTLKVSGTTTSEASKMFGDMALTLMLTEDSVKAPQVVYNAITGRTSTVQLYVHNHVLRSLLTAVRGDKLQLDGNTFSTTYTFTVPKGMNPANMIAVGLISRYAGTPGSVGMKRMDILNANSVALRDVATSISTPSVNALSQVRYYTLDGMEVNPAQLKQGIYIVRDGARQYKKIIR